MTSKDVLDRVREAERDLGNDPPNGITMMRALTALHDAATEIERLRAELKIQDDANEILERRLSGETEGNQATSASLDARISAPTGRGSLSNSLPTSPQAPIARINVLNDRIAEAKLYAPGLPEGEFDLYLEPTDRVPALKATERRLCTCPPDECRGAESGIACRNALKTDAPKAHWCGDPACGDVIQAGQEGLAQIREHGPALINAMLPNDHHPGPRCSCRECLSRYPVPRPATPAAQPLKLSEKEFQGDEDGLCVHCDEQIGMHFQHADGRINCVIPAVSESEL